MWFLNPGMLAGLAALSVPVTIHLWRRRRVVQMPFGSLRFLKKAAARTSRLARVENILLLLLRCLIFALLVLAAAKPVIHARDSRFPGGRAPRTVVLVIDNSASMGCRVGEDSRLEMAKAQAALVAADLKPGDRAAVIAADDRANLLIAEPTTDHAAVRRAIGDVAPTQARGDFSASLREARRIMLKAERGTRQVFLFTDNQETGWRFDPSAVFDASWRDARVELIVARPDAQAPANAGLRKVRWDSPFVGPGITARGRATIENFAEAPLRDVLEVTVNGQRAGQRTVDIPAHVSVEVPVEFIGGAFTGGERWALGEVRLSGDNYPLDDRWFFTLPVYQEPRVLVVGGARAGPERYRSSFFLVKALAVGGTETAVNPASNRAPVVATADELDALDLAGFTAVFLADPGRLSDLAVVRLDRWLDAGGTLVLFPGDLAAAGALDNFDFLPARPGAARDLPAGRLATAVADPGHPLFAHAWDADAPFPALPQRRVMDWKLGDGAKVLATIGENTPLIIAGARGAGATYIVNASADRSWGDLPLSPAFVPLAQQFKRVSAARSGRAGEYTVGDPVPLPVGWPRDAATGVLLPDGTRRELPGGERTGLLDRADLAGNYRITAGKETGVFSVNADPRESNLAPVTLETLAKMAPHEMVSGPEELKNWLGRARGFTPVWPWLLGAALLVLGCEGLLANLAARRRAQGGTTPIRTGRLNKHHAGTGGKLPGGPVAL